MKVQVFVKDHALPYTSHGQNPLKIRTGLGVKEIEKLVSTNSFVRLGVRNRTCFDMVWDHHESKPIVLLTGKGFGTNERVVISVWKIHYSGIPATPPSDILLSKAKEMSATIFKTKTNPESP